MYLKIWGKNHQKVTKKGLKGARRIELNCRIEGESAVAGLCCCCHKLKTKNFSYIYEYVLLLHKY